MGDIEVPFNKNTYKDVVKKLDELEEKKQKTIKLKNKLEKDQISIIESDLF